MSKYETVNVTSLLVAILLLGSMKFIGLISGGKDSFFNIHHCLSQGHELIALGNLHPAEVGTDEIDSFMFQTVGHEVIGYYSECLDVPLYRQKINGTSSNQALEYSITENDEIEDLYTLLSSIKELHPDILGVSCGAILSHYQRTRLENVCDRLGLTSLCFLWQRPQLELMQEMIQSGLDARLIKVAAIGLTSQDLEKPLGQMLPKLIKLNKMYDVHVCGEGGEFETLVLDAPFFKKRLQIIDRQIFNEPNGDVSYLRLKVELVDKHINDLKLADYILDPPHLLEKELDYDSLKTEVELPLVSFEKSNIPDLGMFTSVTNSKSKLYISNVFSEKKNVSEATLDIFTQLTKICKDNDSSLNDIQHVTLLLPNMTQFQEVNKVYQQQFENLNLPPSRVCVETCTRTIQLSCTVLKNISRKQGVHIRSRSYWAPQNIGPYSQAIVEERINDYKLATLSGQIPLVPSLMELTGKDVLYNAILSFQHLFRVTEIIDVKEFASVFCFIVDDLCTEIVRKVWESTEQPNYAQLVILKVQLLPRNADVEWAGISFSKMSEMYEDDSEENESDSEVDLFFTSVVRLKKLNFLTGFTNDPKGIEKMTSKYSRYQLKLMATPSNYKPLDFLGEYLPVVGVYDCRGKEYKYCLQVFVE